MKNLQHQLLLGFNISLFPCQNYQKQYSHSKEEEKQKPQFVFFKQKVQSIIEENIDDEDFGIKNLCQAVALSRSQLHNKIKAATGLSTSIFVRSIRLQKAKYLLETTEFNISELAYNVGFKDPSYFSKLFSKTYGVPPSKYRN